jgi:hypothetical protein
MPKARDFVQKRVSFFKNKSRDPRFLRVIRSNRLRHFEPDVEDVALQLGLDPKSASDRELQLRILSHVHSLREPDSALMRGIEQIPKARGAPRKWGTEEGHRRLMRDIRVAWKDKQKRPSMRKLANLLHDEFPSDPAYQIGPETLEKQLGNHFRRRRRKRTQRRN